MREVSRSRFDCMELILHTDKPYYCTGDTIAGKLQLKLFRPTFLRGVWVKLSGRNIVSIGDKNSIGKRMTVDLLTENDAENIDCVFSKGCLYHVFLGFGEFDSDFGQVIEVQEGKMEWHFEFKVSNRMFCSFYDAKSEIQYVLSGVLDAPHIPMAVSKVSHHLNVKYCRQEIANIYSNNCKRLITKS